MSDYWKICIEEAFEESGITATQDQIDNVAAWAEGAHENYGMAHGYDAIRESSSKKDTSFNFGKPHCYSSSFCRATGSVSESISVSCKNTGKVFYFDSREEAQNFINRNG